MDSAAVVLILAGAASIAVAALQMRGPLATIRHLDRTEANLSRYETWRGRSTGVEADGPTGADIMRQQMRGRLLLWGAVAAGGVAAILIGLLLG